MPLPLPLPLPLPSSASASASGEAQFSPECLPPLVLTEFPPFSGSKNKETATLAAATNSNSGDLRRRRKGTSSSVAAARRQHKIDFPREEEEGCEEGNRICTTTITVGGMSSSSNGSRGRGWILPKLAMVRSLLFRTSSLNDDAGEEEVGRRTSGSSSVPTAVSTALAPTHAPGRRDEEDGQGERQLQQRSLSPSQRHQQLLLRAHGIPNYGQTCFLNSVLQSLASLPSFELHLLRYFLPGTRDDGLLRSSVLDQADAESDQEGYGEPSNQAHYVLGGITRRVLDVLWTVNGGSYHHQQPRGSHEQASAASPLRILTDVARKYPQFASSRPASLGHIAAGTGDQQDAHELFQALVDLIAQEYKAACKTRADTSVVVGKPTNQDAILDDGDECDRGGRMLTAAVALRMKRTTTRQLIAMPLQNDTPLDPRRDSRSSRTQMCASESSAFQEGKMPLQNGTPLHLRSDNRASPTLSRASESSAFQEEKKLEDGAAPPATTQPRDGQLPSLREQNPRSAIAGTSFLHDSDPYDDDTSSSSFGTTPSSVALSSLSSPWIRRAIASATPSLSPSPFSGWIGSILQCRKCHHVRPILNSTFVDIPVVPTRVSECLRRHHSTTSHRYSSPSVSKSRPIDAFPSCTLERCLEEYTSIENVHGVECRSCTHRREQCALEDEADLLRGGIDALVCRAGKKSRNGQTIGKRHGVEGEADHDDPARPLRDELASVEKKLRALRFTSPDDEGAMERVLASNSDGGRRLELDRANEPHQLSSSSPSAPVPLQLERGDAFKCLLVTRLPAVLCIHVQRRFYDPETLRPSKTAQHVAFPEVLDLGPYCAYGGRGLGGQGGRRSGGTALRGGPARIPYRLMAVIEHRGGAYSGHYVCYRRDPAVSASFSSSSSAGNGDWIFVSDARVCRVSWNDVRKCQAYMLFYEAAM